MAKLRSKSKALLEKMHLYSQILQTMGQAGEWVWANMETYKTLSSQVKYLDWAVEHLKEKMLDERQNPGKYRELPVDPITFIESAVLLDMGDEVYPIIKKEIAEICSGKYVEAVLTGGIGSGKTTSGLIILAYGLYENSCLNHPHREYGLAASTEITFIIQSTKSDRAQKDYERLIQMLEGSPYFNTTFKPIGSKKQFLRFPRNIMVRPLSGNPTAAIGENVIGGNLDEVNFMAKVEKSKKASDGGDFDQAMAMYQGIARRRESRFMYKGNMPGMLCLISSKNYPGEFTDVKIEEAKTNPRIYIYDKRTWEVKPESFTGDWFTLFKGNLMNPPKVLEPEEVEEYETKFPGLLMEIPAEYRKAFDGDLLGSVRDIAGVSTLAHAPYFTNFERVVAAFNRAPSLLSRQVCDFQETRVEFYPDKIANRDQPRFAHIDLGVTHDSAGIAVCHVPRFVTIDREFEREVMPEIRYDFILEVTPPKQGEIVFDTLRHLLYKVRDLGLNLKWVTLDSYQSRDTLQILARKGFTVGMVSVDTSPDPYDVLKSAIYDGRVLAPEHAKAQTELLRLEQDPKTGKIDHPADYCFTGDTKVLLSNGSSVAFRDMVGGDFEIMTFDNGVFRPAKAVNPRIEQYVDELIEIEMEDGSVVECTPNHKVLLTNGQWVEAQFLVPTDEIKSIFD